MRSARAGAPVSDPARFQAISGSRRVGDRRSGVESKPGTRNSELGTPVHKLVPPLLSWFAANARNLPWRRTRDPYTIWVSEVMLQQTQVKTVIPYWARWMRELPTIAAAAKARPAKLHKLWEGLGYYTRVRNLQRAAQQIIAQHGGRFPENFDDILALPGIGRYTAGAIASIAFNQPRPILDGNVIRVLTRIFGITTDPREKETNARLWRYADELVTHAKDAENAKGKSHLTLRPWRPLRETNACSYLNQSLMELGALVCTPRSPQCNACPVNKLCVARTKNLQERLPNLGKRETTTERRFVAFVIERKGKLLVRQRPAGVVNAHLWEFPNVEVGARVSDPQRVAAQEAKLKPARLKPLCSIKHSITRYRITLEVWRAEMVNGAPASGPAVQGHWLSLRQLQRHAFTSAHKKILASLSSKREAGLSN